MKVEEFVWKQGLHLVTFLFDHQPRNFRIYIPACLAEKQEAPMVITLHGGDFARAHERTSWHLLAEEKGFYVLYPQSIRDYVMWNAWDNLGKEYGRQDDVECIDRMIDLGAKLTGADRTRLYLHGQSMGDMMGMHYAFLKSGRIAAAYLCSGPTKTKWWMTPEGEMRFHPQAPCPVMRLHGEEDVFQASGLSPTEAKLFKQQCHVEPNANEYLQVNGCDALPSFTVGERFNILSYEGKSGCDFISVFTKNGVHRPPVEAERLGWECFFTAWRLVDGEHIRTAPETPLITDEGAIAAAAGTGDLLVDGGMLIMECAEAISCDNELYIDPVAFDALGIDSKPIIETVREMQRVALVKSLEAAGYTAKFLFDAVYAKKAPFGLTFDLAYNIRSLLGVQKMLSCKEAFALEDRIYRQQVADKGFEEPKTRLDEVWIWGHTV